MPRPDWPPSQRPSELDDATRNGVTERLSRSAALQELVGGSCPYLFMVLSGSVGQQRYKSWWAARVRIFSWS